MTIDRRSQVSFDEISEELGLRPLTARSVLLSVLLGSHPPRLATRMLVQSAEIFGVGAVAVRVALSRMAADGDVVALGGAYELSTRLIERQQELDQGSRPKRDSQWSGAWEMAVITSPGPDRPSRLALLGELTRLKLAPLNDSVWMRPANIQREWTQGVVERCHRFTLQAPEGPLDLLRRLWDLKGWAETAARLIEVLGNTDPPAEKLAVAAAMIRHLRSDPLLPEELLDASWPGPALRRSYADYRAELAALLNSDGNPSHPGREARVLHNSV